MTPEQKQRIFEIENRLPERDGLTPTWSDVDFLLSLVKSQEATPSKSVVRRLAQQGAICRECLYSPTLDLVRLCQRHAAIDDAATSMRSACVEKVREYLTDCREGERGIIEAIASELETFSAEKPKEQE